LVQSLDKPAFQVARKIEARLEQIVLGGDDPFLPGDICQFGIRVYSDSGGES